MQRNIYILDQGTDPRAQQESSNLIHQRKEQPLEQLLFLPVYANKMFRVKYSQLMKHLVEHILKSSYLKNAM